ncbi:MAG: sulfatase-like hydrolase/transferase [Proteobacteria bacterium]|nr:sulfatase-like hydrolase/transferase [Pseudomonadota bacterium]
MGFGPPVEVGASFEEVGRLIDHLESTGEYERTLIVFGSDHGEQLGDHWLFAKYSYFDQSFRIPLILRDPRPEADGGRGRVVSAFTENIDVMPTIVDWLGLKVPVECDGESLLPFCRGKTRPGNQGAANERDGHATQTKTTLTASASYKRSYRRRGPNRHLSQNWT